MQTILFTGWGIKAHGFRAALAIGLSLFACGEAVPVDHPLDPLSREEIRAVVDVLKASGNVNADSRFSLLTLREPPKEEVLHFQPGSNFGSNPVKYRPAPVHSL